MKSKALNFLYTVSIVWISIVTLLGTITTSIYLFYTQLLVVFLLVTFRVYYSLERESKYRYGVLLSTDTLLCIIPIYLVLIHLLVLKRGVDPILISVIIAFLIIGYQWIDIYSMKKGIKNY